MLDACVEFALDYSPYEEFAEILTEARGSLIAFYSRPGSHNKQFANSPEFIRIVKSLRAKYATAFVHISPRWQVISASETELHSLDEKRTEIEKVLDQIGRELGLTNPFYRLITYLWKLHSDRRLGREASILSILTRYQRCYFETGNDLDRVVVSQMALSNELGFSKSMVSNIIRQPAFLVMTPKGRVIPAKFLTPTESELQKLLISEMMHDLSFDAMIFHDGKWMVSAVSLARRFILHQKLQHLTIEALRRTVRELMSPQERIGPTEKEIEERQYLRSGPLLSVRVKF